MTLPKGSLDKLKEILEWELNVREGQIICGKRDCSHREFFSPVDIVLMGYRFPISYVIEVLEVHINRHHND